MASDKSVSFGAASFFAALEDSSGLITFLGFLFLDEEGFFFALVDFLLAFFFLGFSSAAERTMQD